MEDEVEKLHRYFGFCVLIVLITISNSIPDWHMPFVNRGALVTIIAVVPQASRSRGSARAGKRMGALIFHSSCTIQPSFLSLVFNHPTSAFDPVLYLRVRASPHVHGRLVVPFDQEQQFVTRISFLLVVHGWRQQRE